VVRVVTRSDCKDSCIMSDLPLFAGLYEIQGKKGVYYEISIQRMNGVIAIGEEYFTDPSYPLLSLTPTTGSTARPYPPGRLPGWHRLSAALHLDDLSKFFEDPDGGRDCDTRLTRVVPGDTVGFGYEFATGTVFFTCNGLRLRDAFTGVYLPRHAHDVYAALGADGENEFCVNFGGEMFKWKEGNDWAWRVEGHVGRLSGGSRQYDEELPAYKG
jgi:hypothetical protein